MSRLADLRAKYDIERSLTESEWTELFILIDKQAAHTQAYQAGRNAAFIGCLPSPRFYNHHPAYMQGYNFQLAKPKTKY